MPSFPSAKLITLVHLSRQVRIDTVISTPALPTEQVPVTFQLLRRGCLVATTNTTASYLAAPPSPNSAIFDSAGPPPEADGFAIAHAGPGPVGNARAENLGNDDGGRTWQVAGRSDFRRVPEGIRLLGGSAGGPKQVRVGRGMQRQAGGFPNPLIGAPSPLLVAIG